MNTKTKKTDQEKANLQLLINYPHLPEEQQQDLQTWLLAKIDLTSLRLKAMKWFWFLNSKDINRFVATTATSIFEIDEYLENYVDWENWDENLAKLIKNIEAELTESIAYDLAYEITEEVDRIRETLEE